MEPRQMRDLFYFHPKGWKIRKSHFTTFSNAIEKVRKDRKSHATPPREPFLRARKDRRENVSF